MDNQLPCFDDFYFENENSYLQNDDPFFDNIDQDIDDFDFLNESKEAQNENKIQNPISNYHPNKQKVKRRPREIVPVTMNSETFKKGIRSIVFGNTRTKVRKEVIIYYHNLVSARNPEVPHIPREERRNIEKYYVMFSCIQYKILQTLQILKHEGKINYYEDKRMVLEKNL